LPVQDEAETKQKFVTKAIACIRWNGHFSIQDNPGFQIRPNLLDRINKVNKTCSQIHRNKRHRAAQKVRAKLW
jgi:hypothetical protein